MEIKKTMIEALAFVTKHGNMSKENLDLFTNKFCVKSSRASSGEPREAVRLYDVEGNTIGRRCSILKVWLAPEAFNGDVEKIGICREANKLKTANARAADVIIKKAEELRTQANELDDPMEKLAKYEEFDAELARAKEVKNAPITIDDVPDDAKDFNPFNTVEELAEDLGVEVITTKPKEGDETEA